MSAPETALARADDHGPRQLQRADSQVRISGDMTIYDAAAWIAGSRLFKDCTDKEKAFVKILQGQELGLGPMAAMRGLYIINGAAAFSAGLIATLIKRSGKYDYRIRKHSDKECEIEFFQLLPQKESLGTASFTLAQAERAQLLTGGNSANWKKWPEAMLFARTISEGARWHCADVFGGPIYVPEELGARVDEEGAPIIVVEPEQSNSTPQPEQPTSQPAPQLSVEARNAAIEAMNAAQKALLEEWTKQEMGPKKGALEYAARLLESPVRETSDPAGRAEDLKVALEDLLLRPKCLQRLCIASQEAGIPTQEGDAHRKWIAGVIGLELPSRKLYTSLECDQARAVLEMRGAHGNAEAEPDAFADEA